MLEHQRSPNHQTSTTLEGARALAATALPRTTVGRLFSSLYGASKIRIFLLPSIQCCRTNIQFIGNFIFDCIERAHAFAIRMYSGRKSDLRPRFCS